MVRYKTYKHGLLTNFRSKFFQKFQGFFPPRIMLYCIPIYEKYYNDYYQYTKNDTLLYGKDNMNI